MAKFCLALKDMVTRNEGTAGTIWKDFPRGGKWSSSAMDQIWAGFYCEWMPIIAFCVSLTVFNMIVLTEACKNPLHRLMWSED